MNLAVEEWRVAAQSHLATLRRVFRRTPTLDRALGRIRALQQESAAAKSLAESTRQALRAGHFPLEGAALKDALRDRLARHGASPKAKTKGRLHVFLAFPLSNWEAVLPRSLEPFGRVSVYEWRSRGFDDTRSDWLRRRDVMNAEMLAAFRSAHTAQPVDAVVGYLSGHNTSPEVLRQMARSGSVVFNFSWDDKLGFPGARIGGRYASTAALAEAVDLNLTNAPSSVVKYRALGGLAMFWPEAALPEVDLPSPVPFEHDVSFVGACYGWRPNFIARVSRLGVRVECFGKGWPNGAISAEEMTRLYSRSRINLGFAGVGQSRRLMCLKGRDFEVPMSGGLYMTQNNPELSRVYDIGREIVTYKDERDCAVEIKRLLADENAAARIRAAGHRRALHDHTYDARWTALFRFAGLMEDESA